MLGCSDRQLRRWMRQADIDAGRRRGLTTPQFRELAELRRTVLHQEEKIRLLEEARDFFASETR
jgi:transposase